MCYFYLRKLKCTPYIFRYFTKKKCCSLVFNQLIHLSLFQKLFFLSFFSPLSLLILDFVSGDLLRQLIHPLNPLLIFECLFYSVWLPCLITILLLLWNTYSNKIWFLCIFHLYVWLILQLHSDNSGTILAVINVLKTEVICTLDGNSEICIMECVLHNNTPIWVQYIFFEI